MDVGVPPLGAAVNSAAVTWACSPRDFTPPSPHPAHSFCADPGALLGVAGTPPPRVLSRTLRVSSAAQMDLSAQYIKAAVKNVPSVFLMTDSQVAEEQFLVLINDLLASGEIPGLFADDEVENIISSMRPQVKSLGMNDTREACWKFFIEKVRRQLKVRLRLRGPGPSRGPWPWRARVSSLRAGGAFAPGAWKSVRGGWAGGAA